MSQYATTTDFASTFASGAFTSMSADLITTHLVRASAIADSYLQAQYSLPLSSWSPDLTDAVCRIAGYTLIRYRGFKPDGSDQVWKDDYQRAVDWLDAVAKGALNPVIVDGTPSLDEGGPNVTTGLSGRVIGANGAYTDNASTRSDSSWYPNGPYSRGW